MGAARVAPGVVGSEAMLGARRRRQLHGGAARSRQQQRPTLEALGPGHRRSRLGSQLMTIGGRIVYASDVITAYFFR